MRFFAFFSVYLSVSAAFAQFFYNQKVCAHFDSAEAAKTSSAEVVKKVPDNKEIFFTTRWDDSNPAHLSTAKTLNARSVPATCYLNGLGQKFSEQMRKLISEGNAVGNHTANHPMLSSLCANEIFRQIALQSAQIEAALDFPVSAFALPFYNYDCPFDKNIAIIVGRCILDCGCISNPENMNIDNKSRYETDAIYSSSLFQANDHNPNEAMFVRNLATARKQAAARGDFHVTFGVHSWQGEKGLETLGKILDKHLPKDAFYGTENDYASYRFQSENSIIKKGAVSGNSAEFEIRRPATTALGSDIALRLKFSHTPKKVLVDGEGIAQIEGQYRLPVPLRFSTPKKMELLKFGSKNAVAKASKKFAGVSALMMFDKAKLKISATVRAHPTILKDTAFKFILPCGFRVSEISKTSQKDQLTISASLEKDAKFGAYFDDGETDVLCRLDFSYEGKPARIWLNASDGKPPAKCENNPRNNVFILAFNTNEELGNSNGADFSNPEKPLPKIGGKVWEKNFAGNIAPNYFNFRSASNPEKRDNKKRIAFAAVDVTAPRGGEYEIFAKPSKIWVNGAQISLAKCPAKIILKSGKNRIVAAAINGTGFLRITDGERELDFSSPDLEK